MSSYQIVVGFEADSDSDAIEVMEYLDGDLPMAGTPGNGFVTSMPKRHVPSRWEAIRYPVEDEVADARVTDTQCSDSDGLPDEVVS